MRQFLSDFLHTNLIRQELVRGCSYIKLTMPRCVVFYNGEKDSPEESVLKLSDAFANRSEVLGMLLEEVDL